MSAISEEFNWGQRLFTMSYTSFLEGSERLIGVNFSYKFCGSGFFPESVAGFIQAITLKSGCLLM